MGSQLTRLLEFAWPKVCRRKSRPEREWKDLAFLSLKTGIKALCIGNVLEHDFTHCERGLSKVRFETLRVLDLLHTSVFSLLVLRNPIISPHCPCQSLGDSRDGPLKGIGTPRQTPDDPRTRKECVAGCLTCKITFNNLKCLT